MSKYKHKHQENIGLGSHASAGKGWGDGKKARQFHEDRRKHITQRMSTSEYTTFRPRVSLEGAYWTIRDWGSIEVPHLQSSKGYKDTGISLSALFNSLLEGLSRSVTDTTQIDEEGNISIEINLGRINIK